eukprot:4284921-Prymnesium_polylepis.1
MRHLLVAPQIHGRRPRVLDQLLQLLQLSLLLRDEVSQLVPLCVNLAVPLTAPLLARLPRQRR